MKQHQKLDFSENVIENLDGLPPFRPDTRLNLRSNQITELAPLVEKTATATGMLIGLGDNLLTEEAFSRDIPAIEAQGNHVFAVLGNRVAQSTPFSTREPASPMAEVVAKVPVFEIEEIDRVEVVDETKDTTMGTYAVRALLVCAVVAIGLMLRRA